jgi:hypothetical protein
MTVNDAFQMTRDADQNGWDPSGYKLTAWAAAYSLNLAVACFITYWIITRLLSGFVDQASDFLGGMWAVVAVVFVFKDTGEQARDFRLESVDDRQRRAVQHERQRGDLEPLLPDCRHAARQQNASTSERSRQHVAVVERQLSLDHEHRHRRQAKRRLIPAVAALRDAIAKKSADWKDIVKIGRTHMQDAPLYLERCRRDN